MAARGRKETPSTMMMMEVKKKGVLEVTCKKTYVEMKCGCTNFRFGDTVGILRIFTSGQFLIICQCNAEHKEGKMTPAEFEKHALDGARDWKNMIWVMLESEKIPKRLRCKDEAVSKVGLRRAGLLKYYKHGSNLPSRNIVRHRWNFHRDEFVRCTRCGKDRRFLLRNKEQCKLYHEALSSKRWKCRDRPYDPITCDEDEERESRKGSRGCSRARACKGCTSCVCFGCLMCRFRNCNCQSCLDFMQNAPP